MSTTIKVCDLFHGDSIRAENGSEVGMPIFGKFAAVVRRADLRVINDHGVWSIVLPLGSVWSGDWTEDEAFEKANAIVENGGVDSWTTDRDQAKAAAIESASERHEAKMATSGGYRKLFTK